MKNEYFPYLLAFLLGSMSAVSQNLCLSWLDLAILWLKVAKNHGVAEIRVFLGLIFGISLAQSAEELWHSRNLSISGADFWRFSGPQCQRVLAFPKFVSFCIQKRSNFVVWVSFLAGVINCKYSAKFNSLLLLERCKIRRKNIHILGNFDVCRPRFV